MQDIKPIRRNQRIDGKLNPDRTMLTENLKVSFEDIVSSLQNLNTIERIKLQNSLFELQTDLELKEAILEGLQNKRNNQVSTQEDIASEIRSKFQQ
jgi:hypothetical protein